MQVTFTLHSPSGATWLISGGEVEAPPVIGEKIDFSRDEGETIQSGTVTKSTRRADGDYHLEVTMETET